MAIPARAGIAARLASAACVAAAAGLWLASTAGAASAQEPADAQARILVFTKTAGFRHDSIPDAVAALRRLADEQDLGVVHSEDAASFTPENLARFRAVVFASTTGDVLDASQQAAMEAFIRAGGGFLGVHAAADTEYDWPWFGGLVGAWFHSHPPGLQTSRVTFAAEGIADKGREWWVTDELYNYRDNPRERVEVIATLDTSDYVGSTMGEDHPIAWCQPYDGGRAWYTGLGHDSRLYSHSVFLRHLARGLRYVTGVADAC